VSRLHANDLALWQMACSWKGKLGADWVDYMTALWEIIYNLKCPDMYSKRSD